MEAKEGLVRKEASRAGAGHWCPLWEHAVQCSRGASLKVMKAAPSKTRAVAGRPHRPGLKRVQKEGLEQIETSFTLVLAVE